MRDYSKNGLLPVIGGLCMLMTAMGIGRFAYTALLPGMMEAGFLNEHSAGTVAAWNYAGYFIGVLAMRSEKPGTRRFIIFAIFLIINVLSLAWTGFLQTAWALQMIRFVSGIASGICFVLGSAIVLDRLMEIGRPNLAGYFYSGVGLGIAAGGLLSPVLEVRFGTGGAWIGLALFCVLPTLFSLFILYPASVDASQQKLEARIATTRHNQRMQYRILLVVYFLEGFGYIIGATFLVALVRHSSDSLALANTSWVIAGSAAALSAPLWRLAARGGYLKMLIIALLVQGIGMVLPIWFLSPFAILASGLMLGGTFMGITVLALQYGVALRDGSSAKTIATLTAIYGIGQILGPLSTGFGSPELGFKLAFVLSAASLFLAASLLVASQVLTNLNHYRLMPVGSWLAIY